uniref:Uncharacterized protein n=1 Tax=Populus davidiana TaxID=266767 RepID=A0A6M2ENS8_9ROSI
MASSSHRQRQLSLTPRDNHSHGCITQKMKTSITIEDSKQKVTITTETAHKHRPVSKGNRIALEQEVVNRKKKTTIDKQKLLVREEKHEVKERKIYSTTEEKEKKRIPHKHRSGVCVCVCVYLIMVRIICMRYRFSLFLSSDLLGATNTIAGGTLEVTFKTKF